MSEKIKVSIIVVTRNRAELLHQAICSFQNQSFPPELYEIIIVDNASIDHTKKVVQEMSSNTRVAIQYIYEERVGVHYALHRGAKHAKAEILLYGADDIVADEEWVKQIYDCYKCKSVMAVGGRIIGKWDAEIPNWINQFGIKNNGALSLLDLGEGKFLLPEVNSLYGCNFSIRKSILYEVGGFHPDGMPKEQLIYRGDGESGLIKKLKRNRYKVLYTSYAIVEHVISINRLSRSYFKERYYREGISRAYTICRDSKGSNFKLMEDMLISSLRLCLKGFLSLIMRNFKYECFCAYLISRIKHDFRIIKDRELKKYILRDTYL